MFSFTKKSAILILVAVVVSTVIIMVLPHPHNSLEEITITTNR